MPARCGAELGTEHPGRRQHPRDPIPRSKPLPADVRRGEPPCSSRGADGTPMPHRPEPRPADLTVACHTRELSAVLMVGTDGSTFAYKHSFGNYRWVIGYRSMRTFVCSSRSIRRTARTGTSSRATCRGLGAVRVLSRDRRAPELDLRDVQADTLRPALPGRVEVGWALEALGATTLRQSRSARTRGWRSSLSSALGHSDMSHSNGPAS